MDIDGGGASPRAGDGVDSFHTTLRLDVVVVVFLNVVIRIIVLLVRLG